MGKMLRVMTWELVAMAFAGFNLGGSLMYGLVNLAQGGWRPFNAGLIAFSQLCVILAILRGTFGRTRAMPLRDSESVQA
jgi:hypothetical protein